MASSFNLSTARVYLSECRRNASLCAVYSDSLYLTLDEMKLRERMGLFRLATKNKKALVNTFVTTYGVVHGKYKSIIHSEVKMDDLFNS